MRILFVNENVGGHATLHGHLEAALAGIDDAEADFIHCPRRGPLRRIAARPIPGLASRDLDLAPLRNHLGASVVARRLLRDAPARDVLHMYSQQIALLSADELRSQPSLVGTDATTAQSVRLLPYRNPTRFTDRASAIGRRLERRVFEAATLLVAQSEWAAQSMVDDCGIDPDRIRVVRYGVRVDDVPDVEADDPPTIYWTGRSMERKGGRWLLDVWRRHLRDDCRLVLITPQPVDPEPGLEVIADLTPDQHDRRNRLLAAASVFCFPSDMDTFGYAPIEAMAMATPVVALRATALPETVPDGECGLLVEPGDDQGLADALRRLLADDGLRARMGAAARERVLTTFDARVTTRLLVDAAHEAIERHAG